MTAPALLLLIGCGGGFETPKVGGDDNPLPTGSDGDSGSLGGDDSGRAGSDDSAQETGSPGDTGVPGGADCAVTQGAVACDLSGVDEAGRAFHLWDLLGDPVVIVVGNAWDNNLALASGFVEASAAQAGGAAVVVLLDGADQIAADTSDAAAWAAQYGLDTVLSDPDQRIRVDWAGNAGIRTWVIDADMVIRWSQFGYLDADTLDAQLSNL